MANVRASNFSAVVVEVMARHDPMFASLSGTQQYAFDDVPKAAAQTLAVPSPEAGENPEAVLAPVLGTALHAPRFEAVIGDLRSGKTTLDRASIHSLARSLATHAQSPADLTGLHALVGDASTLSGTERARAMLQQVAKRLEKPEANLTQQVIPPYRDAESALQRDLGSNFMAAFDDVLAPYDPSLAAISHTVLLLDPDNKALGDLNREVANLDVANPRTAFEAAFAHLDRTRLPEVHRLCQP
jgi:hypothetical protein